MQRMIVSFLFLIVLFASCKKDSAPSFNAAVKAALTVEFDNIAGSEDLKLNNVFYYLTANGDSIKVSKLKYYVSNFSFTNVDGSLYTIPQDSSYHLIIEGDSSTYEPEFNIPEGEYKAVSFLLGVDSLRNTQDVSKRTGDLDVTDSAKGGDMYWSWNSGYIFYKLEGISPQVAGMMGKSFMYHIGLFGGKTSPTLNNLRKVTLDLTQRGTPKVKAGKETNIHLTVDVLKTFSGTATVKLADNSMVMANPYSATVANNLPGIFSHAHTHN